MKYRLFLDQSFNFLKTPIVYIFAIFMFLLYIVSSDNLKSYLWLNFFLNLFLFLTLLKNEKAISIRPESWTNNFRKYHLKIL